MNNLSDASHLICNVAYELCLQAQTPPPPLASLNPEQETFAAMDSSMDPKSIDKMLLSFDRGWVVGSRFSK